MVTNLSYRVYRRLYESYRASFVLTTLDAQTVLCRHGNADTLARREDAAR